MIHIYRILDSEVLCPEKNGQAVSTKYQIVTCLECIEIEIDLLKRTLKGEPIYDKRSAKAYLPIVSQRKNELTFKKDFKNLVEK